jgi:UDP-N-acetylglucosamine 1-carboxyvinyltransferase
MSKLIIEGGRPLHGSIETNSAKNSAVAILCACAMLEGKTTLTNVPVIEEVKRIIEVLESIGIRVAWTGGHELEIDNPGKLEPENINRESFLRTRSGLLLMGALAGKLDSYRLPKSSGCLLGNRTVNPYLIAMDYLGYAVSVEPDYYLVKRRDPASSSFTMYESGDTATENTIMAAALTPGVSEIHFASSNYMTQDLCFFLEQAGAKIEGIGSNCLKITGVESLKPVKSYPIMPDPIESMAFISIAITTSSELMIKKCPLDFLRLELEKLRVMGQQFDLSPVYKSDNGRFDLVDITIKPSHLRALPDKIYGRPYPGLNIDNLPLFVPILTQAEGETLVHDWVYENRIIYYIELNRLGADIKLHDPHRVTITGPTKLMPAEIICPPALRPSINLLICMLAAKGRSILRNSYSIDRGYEDIVGRLNALGGNIRHVANFDF